jgi:hypothetical protein
MKSIRISDTKKIAALQQEFNEAFPYLRIEFFTREHGSRGASARRDMLDADTLLKRFQRKNTSGAIMLKGSMKVSELEALFKDHFGLSVQVFRKSGRSWIETTVTDDWTLEEQNAQGQELSSL